MKHLEKLACTLLLWAVGTLATAQQRELSCECYRVRAEIGNGFASYDPKRARETIDSYLNMFDKDRRPIINLRPYTCDDHPAYAAICFKSLAMYIFYSRPFFDDLEKRSRLGDKFILAHELSHHLLGHSVRRFLDTQGHAETDSIYRSQTLVMKNRKSETRTFIINVPLEHLQELEADALGLWMSIKQGMTRRDMDPLFDKVLPELLRIYDRDRYSATHPSINVRKRLLMNQWSRYEDASRTDRYQSSARKQGQSFAAYTAASTPLGEEVEEAYVFELVNLKRNEITTLEKVEKQARDSLTRHTRFSLDLVLGGQLQRPDLVRNNAAVAATDSRAFLAGIQLGVGSWFRKHRFEMDLLVNTPTKFATLQSTGDQTLVSEQFSTKRYVYVRPRYVFSGLSRSTGNGYRTNGWMATAGASVNIPIGFSYVNKGVTMYQSPAVQPSVGIVAGVGYGKAHWRNRDGHYKLWLLYQPQPLRLQTTAPDSIRARLHTVSLEAHFRFW